MQLQQTYCFPLQLCQCIIAHSSLDTERKRVCALFSFPFSLLFGMKNKTILIINRWGSNLTIVSENIQLAQWYHIGFFVQYNEVVVNGSGYTGRNYTVARMIVRQRVRERGLVC